MTGGSTGAAAGPTGVVDKLPLRLRIFTFFNGVAGFLWLLTMVDYEHILRWIPVLLMMAGSNYLFITAVTKNNHPKDKSELFNARGRIFTNRYNLILLLFVFLLYFYERGFDKYYILTYTVLLGIVFIQRFSFQFFRLRDIPFGGMGPLLSYFLGEGYNETVQSYSRNITSLIYMYFGLILTRICLHAFYISNLYSEMFTVLIGIIVILFIFITGSACYFISEVKDILLTNRGTEK